MTLVFTEPVAAFGFFGTDFGDGGGSMEIITSSDNGTVRMNYTIGHTIGSDGNGKVSCHNLHHTTLSESNTHFGTSLFYYPALGAVLFWGVIDTINTFTSVEFTNILDEVFGFDNFTIGTVSQVVTVAPTQSPTSSPSKSPSSIPSGDPSSNPSGGPSTIPSDNPSENPSSNPSGIPSISPSSIPTAKKPTRWPTRKPTKPTSWPTRKPTKPTSRPTRKPTKPTSRPTRKPSSH
jgi:hypothetical protein